MSEASQKITDKISEAIGVTTYVDYGETVVIYNRYYDEEVEGHSTGLGYFLMFITFALAIRGGLAVYTGKLNGGITPTGNLALLTWTVGLFVYGIIDQVIFFSLNLPEIVANIINIVSAAGIGFFAYSFYQGKVDEMKSKECQQADE